MCTAVSYKNGSHYFGRNLDLEYSYRESVTVTPRNYPLVFREMPAINAHYAIIGMAYVQNNYPLYYDAANEKGLAAAGLSFWDYARYGEKQTDRDNIAPFELIPWVLSQCANINKAKKLLEHVNLVDIAFSETLPVSPLHFMFADKSGSVVLESTAEGMRIFENTVGVLTNNPPFDYQLMNLNNYMGISNQPVKNSFSSDLPLYAYSRGMGGIGLPGDFSSQSRFVKAAFVLQNSRCGESEDENISQFFHILDTVVHPRGSVNLGGGKYEITVYSSCCNTDRGIYYYTTYENRQITAVDMHREKLDSDRLIAYPVIRRQYIFGQN